MDPLSVTASVVGLLAATAKVSKLLSAFINGARKAPELAEKVLMEVSDVSAALTQLQTSILDLESANPSRKRMVMLDKVVVTLTNCVLIFSDLESMVCSLNVEDPNRSWARVAWARQESRIATLLERLQGSKTSLTLMVSILTCDSAGEAASAVKNLTSLVQQLLQKNEDLESHLRSLKNSASSHFMPSLVTQRSETTDDDTSTVIPGPERSLLRSENHMESSILTQERESPHDNLSNIISGSRLSSTAASKQFESRKFRFEFDPDLFKSWVYIRAMRRESCESLPSSATKSFAWSCLSDRSLDQITNLSVISLPITHEHLSNSRHYKVAQVAESPIPGLRLSKPTTSLSERIPLSWASSRIDDTYHSFQTFASHKWRMVLLGTRHSGKTTIRKQLSFLHGYELLDEERGKYGGIILQNIFEAFTTLQEEVLTPEEKAHLCVIKSLLDFSESFGTEDPTRGPDYDLLQLGAVRAVRALAPNPAIREMIQMQDETGSNANFENLVGSLDNFSSDSFLASDAQILRARESTKQQSTSTVSYGSFYYSITDLGGARSQRSSWRKYLGPTHFIVFTVALTGYSQFLPENHGVSDMEESLKEFEELVRLTRKPIILLFTKLDLLEERLQYYPFSQYHSAIRGYLPRDFMLEKPSCEEACEFFAQRFRDLDRRSAGDLYIDFTSTIQKACFVKNISWFEKSHLANRRPIEALMRLKASRPSPTTPNSDEIFDPDFDQDATWAKFQRECNQQ